MSTFLHDIAKQILEKHGSNLSRVLVLLPNQRSCTYFRNALHSLANKAVLSPEISTLQNFMLSQSELTTTDTIELITELYACHRETGGDATLDDFIGTAHVMLDDFNELDMQMVNAKSFFKNLELLQSMNVYEPGAEPSEYKIKYRRFWENFGELYHRLRERLKAKRKGYQGMILREVAENISALNTSAYDAVYLAAFSGLNKTDEVAIIHLLRGKKAEIFWDADAYYVNDEMQEAGYFFRKYAKQFKIPESTWKTSIANNQRKVTIIGAAKNIGQVKVAADVLARQLAINETNALNTVVVVPDEKLLLPLIAHIPASVNAVNITMGLTIAGSNTASWFEILFRLFDNSQRYTSGSGKQRFYYKDVFSLLQHNFFRLLMPDKPVLDFMGLMKKRNRVLISADEMVNALGEEMKLLFFEGEDGKAYTEFLHRINTQLLSQLVYRVRHGNKALSSEVEIAHRVMNIIESASKIFEQGNEVSIKTFITLLREQFRQERVPLEGEPVQGLQIMGLQETRGLDFENVIVLSANEGILPSGKNQRTFIPYELRREFLTTHKEKDAITAYLFYRLLHKAKKVFLLYNTEPDELGGGEKSRFILQLQREMAGNPNTKIQDLIFAVDPPPAANTQPIVIEKTENVTEKLQRILTTSGLSPSALNTYINCPLQYYFRYIAGLREEDDMEESPEASTIGSAVHHALEKIYEPLNGKTVTPFFLEAAWKNRERIEQLVRENLSERFDAESLSRGKSLLLYKVCVKLAEEFLKHEWQLAQQLEEQGIKTEMLMQEQQLKATLQIDDTEMLVSGRVDRVERLEGIVQIADYKTGNAKKLPVLNEEAWDELFTNPKYAKAVQLLVYAWLYYRTNGSNVLPLRSGIYWLRDADKKFNALCTSAGNDLLTENEVQRFEEKLTALISELNNRTAPFTQTEDVKRCAYCDFVRICGRD